jgi:hypothetical protein
VANDSPHDFDSPPPPNFIWKSTESWYIPSKERKHQIFRALDNVAHDITGNAWKSRAIVFFFLHGEKEEDPDCKYFPECIQVASRQKHGKAGHSGTIFLIFCSRKALLSTYIFLDACNMDAMWEAYNQNLPLSIHPKKYLFISMAESMRCL